MPTHEVFNQPPALEDYDLLGTDAALAEGALRRVCRDLVVALQAGLLARHAPGFVADAFIASRVRGEGAVFGRLGARRDPGPGLAAGGLRPRPSALTPVKRGRAEGAAPASADRRISSGRPACGNRKTPAPS